MRPLNRAGEGSHVRITNRIIQDRAIASIRQGQGRSAGFERQIATGQRFERISEDPVAGRAVLEIDTDLRRTDQISRNIEAARTRVRIEDATLRSVTGILSRARELGIQQASDTGNADTRTAASLEVTELRAAIVQSANQTVGGAYVFGGAYPDRPPLDSTGALDPATPARGAPAFEIAKGVQGFGAHDAGQVFIDSDVIGSLDALATALSANDRAGVETATDRVRAAISEVQELIADIGARDARLDSAAEANLTLENTLLDRRSDLADASLDEAVVQLASTQASLQAALLATSRILDSTLTNFLR